MDLSSAKSAISTFQSRPKVPTDAALIASSINHLLYMDKDTPPQDKVPLLEEELLSLLLYAKERWEPLATSLKIVQDQLNSHFLTQNAAITSAAEMEKSVELERLTVFPFRKEFLISTIAPLVLRHLEHPEPRIRMEIAKTIGSLAKWDFQWAFQSFSALILESVECNMTRSPDYEESEYVDMDDNISMNGMETPPRTPNAGTPKTPSTPHRLDDVSGWKALESSLCAWKYMIEASGQNFLTIQDNMEDTEWPFCYLHFNVFQLLTEKSVFHVNRHVRVVGLDIITVLCNAATSGCLSKYRRLSDTMCKCIVRGAQDNWSQVRYAASISTRYFLLKLHEQDREIYMGQLIPRLCLNRYYIAERVQKYSQETWQLVVGNNGRSIVAKYAREIVAYYVEMTNHCVREAACHCIAELATKVDANAIRPYTLPLLQALLSCFQDSSWLVRDAACLSSAQFVLGFPQESLVCLDQLYTFWIDHLSDEIWSVREDAAIALGNVIRAYGKKALDRVSAITGEYLQLAKKQIPMSQNDFDEKMKAEKQHLSKQAFSCCSLEPKCDIRAEPRNKELWEYTDGAIYLVRELCFIAPESAVQYLSPLADVAILRHFPQCGTLQVTVWTQLPNIAKALGKQIFKRYLELFLDPLIFTLDGNHRLARCAAQMCVVQVNELIGSTIFLGRLQANPVWHERLAPLLKE